MSDIEQKEEEMDINEVAKILAMGFFKYLADKEGVVVHHGDNAYVIYHEDDEIKLNRDNALLDADHLQLLWLHDPDDPDDNIPDDAPQLPKRLLN